jgi:hypothetical protein
MSEWARVKWSEARQIISTLGWDEEAAGDVSAPPKVYFDRLVDAGRFPEAATFLGQALPRLEAVAWAARAVQDLRENDPKAPGGPEAQALKSALLWVQDPSEPRRRAAYDAAEAADGQSAEHLAALAAFFSGGSIAPADAPPLPAPREAAGRFASGAVMVAAARTGDMNGALQRCLETGQAIAERGLSGAA